MTTVQPSNRPDAERILKHPYFTFGAQRRLKSFFTQLKKY